jgi:hypothetical protein
MAVVTHSRRFGRRRPLSSLQRLSPLRLQHRRAAVAGKYHAGYNGIDIDMASMILAAMSPMKHLGVTVTHGF